MNSQHKSVDAFQIAGFALSGVISVGLIIAKQDTIQSVMLGLVLAVLTQLFDLQIRHRASEERLMQASTLDEALHGDQWLLRHIQEIVTNYLVAKKGWFDLFQRRANDVIVECRNVVKSLAEGHMAAELHSPFSFGSEAFNIAKKSIKHVVAIVDIPFWRSTFAEKAFPVYERVLKRGVAFTRVYIHPLEALQQMVDVLERQQQVGIEVYVVFPSDIPEDLHEEYMVMDDRAFARLELAADRGIREQRISIEPVEVERMVRNFQVLLFHARKLDEVIDDLKQ